MKKIIFSILILHFTPAFVLSQTVIRQYEEIFYQENYIDGRGKVEEVVVLTHSLLSDGERFAIARIYLKEEYENRKLRVSPANLTTDIPWDEDPVTAGVQKSYANNTLAEAAFNNGRRMEEAQNGLVLNSLGNITIPTSSDDDLALAVYNLERSARAGIDYGSGGTTVLEMQNIEFNIDTISDSHLQDMLANNFFSHYGTNGQGPFQRIENNSVIGNNACSGSNGYSFLPRAENLSVVFTSAATNPMIILRALYNFVYADEPSWGHREASLLGDQALNGQNGFVDDFGASGTEGFIGFAVGGRNNKAYYPFGTPPSWLDRSDVLVMNFFDPVNASCSYLPGVSGLSVLPIEFVSFDVQFHGQSNQLSWSSYEDRTSHYEIEFSKDGKTWQYLESVLAKNINNLNSYKYTYLEENILVFYRIKGIDLDNSHIYSEQKVLQRKGKIDMILFPNPVHEKLLVSAKNVNSFTFEIFNLQGKLMFKGESDTEIDCSGLNAGEYIIKVQNGYNFNIKRFEKL